MYLFVFQKEAKDLPHPLIKKKRISRKTYNFFLWDEKLTNLPEKATKATTPWGRWTTRKQYGHATIKTDRRSQHATPTTCRHMSLNIANEPPHAGGKLRKKTSAKATDTSTTMIIGQYTESHPSSIRGRLTSTATLLDSALVWFLLRDDETGASTTSIALISNGLLLQETTNHLARSRFSRSKVARKSQISLVKGAPGTGANAPDTTTSSPIGTTCGLRRVRESSVNITTLLKDGRLAWLKRWCGW